MARIRFNSERLRAARTADARLCVMISGGGRTLLNLHERISRGLLPASVELVIASRPCRGGERAAALGLKVATEGGCIERQRLGAMLREHRIDWVLLAGYLQLVRIPEGYQGRVVNIHPALLPDFGGPGMWGDRVHEAVLAARRRISGCTVHLCDEVYDRGPLVLQRTCRVLPGDTPQKLAARVFEQEREAYPAAMKLLLG